MLAYLKLQNREEQNEDSNIYYSPVSSLRLAGTCKQPGINLLISSEMEALVEARNHTVVKSDTYNNF